jgi:hypothetical protein
MSAITLVMPTTAVTMMRGITPLEKPSFNVGTIFSLGMLRQNRMIHRMTAIRKCNCRPVSGAAGHSQRQLRPRTPAKRCDTGRSFLETETQYNLSARICG